MIPQRWPLHLPPLPGEVLSSWLERTARLYQLTLTALVEHNLAMQDIQLGGADLPRERDRLDIDPPARLLQAVHDRSGVPVEHLRHMNVAGWTPWLLDTLDVDQADAFDTFVRQDSLLFDHIAVARRPAPGRWRPWLPATGYGERGRRTCPQCAERPEVVATDPIAGRTGVRTVTTLIRGTGVKHLVDISVDQDHDAHTAPTVITATEGHPFWVPASKAWVNAGDLVAGSTVENGASRSRSPRWRRGTR